MLNAAPETTALRVSQSARFTRDGSAELERRLDALCQETGLAVVKEVGAGRLDALVLGGGYGRGQGGVLRTAQGDCPYNDLEFYVFLRGNPELNKFRHGSALEGLSHALSSSAGLHVEFKIDSLEKLRAAPVSIFSYDLVAGHRVIVGPENAFHSCSRHLDASRIERSEPARLLLNRCSGLLLARELLARPSVTSTDCDFIGRNLAKVELALGDALLAADGDYHWDCLERGRRLLHRMGAEKLECFDEVLHHHAQGIEFKLHPKRMVKSAEQFEKELRELIALGLRVWLWVENKRLKSNFATIEEYALSPRAKCTGDSRWKNVLLNLRTFGASATLDPCSPRYPRERLLNALPFLLATQGPLNQPTTVRHLQRQLRTEAQDWAGMVKAYKQVWSCYG